MRRAAMATIAVIVAVLAVIASLEVWLTEPQTLFASGQGVRGVEYEQNSTQVVYVPDPGRVTGSWYTPVGGLRAKSTELYGYDQCTHPNWASTPAACNGTTVWTQASLTGNGSIDTSLPAGFYYFVWTASNATQSPYIVIGSPITLHPTPWWWL